MARKSVEPNIAFDDVNRTYYVCFDYGKDENGKRIKKYKTYEKISEARKALREFSADKTKGEIVIPNETTLAEWLEYYLTNIVQPNRELTTLYGYMNITNKYIIPELGKTTLQAITPTQIQRYYTKLRTENSLSPNSVRKHHDFLKTALKAAVMQDILSKNPLERVEPPKLVKKEIDFYPKENLVQLLDLVKGNRLEIVIYLAVLLGLRREEICGLTWSNCDFQKRVVKIRDAKTMAGSMIIDKDTKNRTSSRTLFIVDELLDALLREKHRQEGFQEKFGTSYENSDLLVCWENGQAYRPNYISEMFQKFIEDNKLPKITLHGLRHSFVSLGNSEGETLYNLSKAAGHATPDVTGRIYAHLEDNTHEDLLKNIAQGLFGKGKK